MRMENLNSKVQINEWLKKEILDSDFDTLTQEQK